VKSISQTQLKRKNNPQITPALFMSLFLGVLFIYNEQMKAQIIMLLCGLTFSLNIIFPFVHIHRHKTQNTP
jgi:uncharacterized membrane protein HdeD (DUF308 family)